MKAKRFLVATQLISFWHTKEGGKHSLMWVLMAFHACQSTHIICVDVCAYEFGLCGSFCFKCVCAHERVVCCLESRRDVTVKLSAQNVVVITVGETLRSASLTTNQCCFSTLSINAHVITTVSSRP